MFCRLPQLLAFRRPLLFHQISIATFSCIFLHFRFLSFYLNSAHETSSFGCSLPRLGHYVVLDLTFYFPQSKNILCAKVTRFHICDMMFRLCRKKFSDPWLFWVLIGCSYGTHLRRFSEAPVKRWLSARSMTYHPPQHSSRLYTSFHF